MRFIMVFFSLSLLLAANESTDVKLKRLVQKGKRVAALLCKSQKLPAPHGSVQELAKELLKSDACVNLDREKSEALAAYLFKGTQRKKVSRITVPNGSKCPVCGMFVYKYPKWAATMQIGAKTLYFDGVKDMLKYYFFDKDFPYDRDKIKSVTVTDYYTLEALDATKAYYVIGSNVYGPMGNELIAFKSKDEALKFKEEHRGKAVLKLSEITPQMMLSFDKEGSSD